MHLGGYAAMSTQALLTLPGRRSSALAALTASPVALALSAFVAVRLVALGTLVALAGRRGESGYRVLVKWDAQWYRGIAENGYGFTRLHEDGRLLSDYAFFPLFPFVERWVGRATGLVPVDAGLLVSLVCSVAAAWGIYAVAAHVYSPRVGVTATVLWAALPVGVVQWMAYSESLFTALAAWSLHAVLTRRWLLAGALACCAGLTRPTGVAVVAAVVVAAAVEHRSRARGTSSGAPNGLGPVAATLLAPLGALGYLVWVGLRVGDPTGYFDVTGGWNNGLDGGVAFAAWTGELLGGPAPLSGLLVLAGVVALIGVLCLTVRQRQPLPLLVFCAVLVTLALTTSGYFGSKPRYLLPAFPLLLPLARWMASRHLWLSSTLLAVLAVVSAVYGAGWLLGPGPP